MNFLIKFGNEKSLFVKVYSKSYEVCYITIRSSELIFFPSNLIRYLLRKNKPMKWEYMMNDLNVV